MAYIGFHATTNATWKAAWGVGFPINWHDPEGRTEFTMPEAGWPRLMGIRATKQTTAATQAWFYLCYWSASSGQATTLLGHSEAMRTTVHGFFNWVSASLSNKNLLHAGQKVALGWTGYTGQALIVANAAASAALYDTEYRAGGGVVTPPNPFSAGGSVVRASGQQAPIIWLTYEPNSEPFAPTNVSINNITTHGPILTSTLPTFRFRFSDQDQINGDNEKITGFEFRVMDTVSGVQMWPTSVNPTAAEFVPSAAEQVANTTIARTYPGAASGSTALVSGGSYTMEVRTKDVSNTWGDWSPPFPFTIASIGAVDVSDGTPTDKIDTVTDAISFTGRWHHPSNTATSHVRVEILRSDGSRHILGPETAKVIASGALPGNLFTVSPVEAGVGTLPRGTDLAYRIQVKAGGVWTDFSGQRAFTTNAPPTTPVPTNPIDDQIVTAPPLLTWLSSDPDDDDIMGADVVWTVEVTRPAPLSILTLQHPTRPMSYDADLSLASLALDATDCSLSGIYSWRVRADDLSASAVQAGYGQSAWSDPVQFTLSAGPAPTITLPSGSTVSTVTPLLRFAVTNGPHVAYRMILYVAGTTTKVWDSQRVNASTFDVVVPAGYLRNSGRYDAVVTVWNASEVAGISSVKTFTVTYTTPDAILDVTSELYAAERDPHPTIVLVAWQRTIDPNFVGYYVRRRLASEPATSALLIAAIANAGQTRMWDFHAPPGNDLIYSVSLVRRTGIQIVEGPSTEIEARIDFDSIVITTTRTPGTDRFVLTYLPASISESPKQNLVPYTTWGGDNVPVMISTPGIQEVWSISGVLITDQHATREAQAAAIKRINKTQGIVSVRHGQDRIFAKITDFRREVGTGFDPDTVTFTVQETNFKEGQQK